jgi:hypothetical protein
MLAGSMQGSTMCNTVSMGNKRDSAMCSANGHASVQQKTVQCVVLTVMLVCSKRQ